MEVITVLYQMFHEIVTEGVTVLYQIFHETVTEGITVLYHIFYESVTEVVTSTMRPRYYLIIIYIWHLRLGSTLDNDGRKCM